MMPANLHILLIRISHEASAVAAQEILSAAVVRYDLHALHVLSRLLDVLFQYAAGVFGGTPCIRAFCNASVDFLSGGP